MSDEQQIVIANNGGGVINVLIIGSNPIVISDPNITAPGEVLPPGDNVDNSTIISPNNAIDVTAPGEVLPPGNNVDNSTIISPNKAIDVTAPGEVLPPGDNVDNSTIISPNKAIDVNEKKQVNLSSSPSPIESLVTSILAFGLILTLLICFWPYILSGGLLLLIVRIVWLWLKDQFS